MSVELTITGHKGVVRNEMIELSTANWKIGLYLSNAKNSTNN